jgi:hypothetical protein
MREAAANLEFETAARLRDEIKRMKLMDLEFANEVLTGAGDEVDKSAPKRLRAEAAAEKAEAFRKTPRIPILGENVHTADDTHPAIPPCLNAETALAGLARAKASLEAQGFTVDLPRVQPDPATAEAETVAQLTGQTYAVVVIGAGIRNPPPSLGLFETVLNAVHRHAPGARIAFNTRPDDSDVAAVRWVGR